jgi:hypothetical protein
MQIIANKRMLQGTLSGKKKNRIKNAEMRTSWVNQQSCGMT